MPDSPPENSGTAVHVVTIDHVRHYESRSHYNSPGDIPYSSGGIQTSRSRSDSRRPSDNVVALIHVAMMILKLIVLTVQINRYVSFPKDKNDGMEDKI